MADLEGLTLHIGADDSNHAGTAKGEIIVATFSILPEDGKSIKRGNRRDIPAALKYMSAPGRDWRFTLLTGEEFRHSAHNLVYAVPYLVESYLADFESPERIENVRAYLDGSLRSQHKQELEESLLEVSSLSEGVTAWARGYMKKKHVGKGISSKGYDCPNLIWCADTLSNHMFRTPTGDMLMHPKFVGEYRG